MGADSYESKVYIDGEFQFSGKMKYSGIANNAYGEEGDPDHMKYTIETTQGQVFFGLMPVLAHNSINSESNAWNELFVHCKS